MDKLIRELVWFCNESETAMGYKSSYNSFLQQMYSPGHQAYTETIYTDKLLKVIARHRIMYQAVHQLTSQQYQFVNALYLDENQAKYPKSIKLIFEKQTGIAISLHPDPKELNEQCSKFLHQSLQPHNLFLFNQFKNQVEYQYNLLHDQLLFLINQRQA